MNDLELRDLKEDVRGIYYQNIEEIFLMTKYCLIAYAKSIFTYGRKHFITQEIVQVWKEFFKIILEEKYILSYLVKNGLFEDFEEVNQFLFQLDDVNEETIQYYYDVLDGIETACEMNLEWKAMRPRKEFSTLIETDFYRKNLFFFTLSMEDIKNFLGYEEEFWKYIEKRVLLIDSHIQEDNEFFGVNMKFDDNYCLSDIKVFVPKIINLETALVNVHEFHHAYRLYKLLGEYVPEKSDSYEKMAKDSENVFQEEYVLKKYKNFFNKRL